MTDDFPARRVSKRPQIAAAWEPLQSSTFLEDPPPMTALGTDYRCTNPQSANDPGMWLHFTDERVSAGAWRDDRLDTSKRLLSEASTAPPLRTLHRNFARLFLAPDDAILKWAQQRGPLGSGWKAEDGWWEPLSMWRGEAAHVSWLCAIADLARHPAGKQPYDKSSDGRRYAQLIEETVQAARKAAEWVDAHPTEHGEWIAMTKIEFGISSASYEARGESHSRLRDIYGYSLFQSGWLQSRMKKHFVAAAEGITYHLPHHLRVYVEWQSLKTRANLRIVAPTQLGTIYAATLLEATGNRRPMKTCANPKCNEQFFYERATKETCSDACRKQLERHRKSQKFSH